MTWTNSIAFVFLLLWQTPNVKCTDDLTTESESDHLYMPIKPIEDFELKNHISPQCERLGICDDVDYYPETIIDEVIRNLTKKNHVKIFYTEECPFVDTDNAYKHIEPLCKYQSECLTPKAVKSQTGTWYLVLNTKESPLQVFTGQVCKHLTLPLQVRHNRRCSKSLMHSNTTCEQVYFERPMIVLNSEMNAVVLKHLPVPCCCKCYIHQ